MNTSPANLFLTLLILTGPDGRAVIVNSEHITSMHAAKPDEPNQLMVEGVRCLINMSDGKFVSVVQTCDEVKKRVAQ